jgi:hypothetical protein
MEDWMSGDFGLDEESDRVVNTFRVPESELNSSLRCGDTVAIGVEQFYISDWEDGMVTIERLSEDERDKEVVWSRAPLNLSCGSVHAAIGYPTVQA